MAMATPTVNRTGPTPTSEITTASANAVALPTNIWEIKAWPNSKKEPNPAVSAKAPMRAGSSLMARPISQANAKQINSPPQHYQGQMALPPMLGLARQGYENQSGQGDVGHQPGEEFVMHRFYEAQPAQAARQTDYGDQHRHVRYHAAL